MDRRSLRAAANEPFFSASWRSRRFFRMMNHHIKNTTMAMAATPPTTPPAIAPVSVPPEFEGAAPVETHLVVAHASQLGAVMVHIDPSGHAGQAGDVVSHCLQRLKTERAGEKAESMGSKDMVGEEDRDKKQRKISIKPVNGKECAR